MWPFTRGKRRERDLLLEDVDLTAFAPFAEVERYLLVFPAAVGLNYVLVLVYQAGTGERVHVAHSPGINPQGGAMEKSLPWLATGVRRRDPRAIALLTSWPPDTSAGKAGGDQLVRSHFAPLPGGRASPGRTVLMNEDGEVDNELTRDQVCLYEAASLYPRLSSAEWSRILGTEVRRFTTTEWAEAADEVDPDRSIRDAAVRESEHRFAVFYAFLDEQGA